LKYDDKFELPGCVSEGFLSAWVNANVTVNSYFDALMIVFNFFKNPEGIEQ